jgi:beta-lactamase class D
VRPRSALAVGFVLGLAAGCAPEPPPAPESAREASPLRFQEEPAFGRLFEEAGATGTLVVLDPARSRVLVHDSVRARERFIPASTFKVANALVALETGAVADTLEPFG